VEEVNASIAEDEMLSGCQGASLCRAGTRELDATTGELTAHAQSAAQSHTARSSRDHHRPHF